YRAEFQIRREYVVRLLTWRDLDRLLKDLATGCTVRYDELLVAIVTDGEASDRHQARQSAQQLAGAGYPVGVPRGPLHLSDPVRDVRAAEAVATHPDFRGTPYAELALRRRQNTLLDAITEQVAVDAFDWYLPDTPENPIRCTELAALL